MASPCVSCAHCRPHPCTCIQNYWINPDSGANYLRGCCCDPDNPIRLADEFIAWALQNSQVARADFRKLYPALFPCEKERFDTLFADNPMLFRLVEDPKTTSDRFQRRMNATPVYTAGKLGGRHLPVGRVAQMMNLPPHLAPKAQPKGC